VTSIVFEPKAFVQGDSTGNTRQKFPPTWKARVVNIDHEIYNTHQLSCKYFNTSSLNRIKVPKVLDRAGDAAISKRFLIRVEVCCELLLE